MSAGTDREEDRQTAAEHALGLLDAAEAGAFEARLAAEPELRAEYALWAGHLAVLNDEIEALTPPEGTYEKIEARQFAEPAPACGGLVRWLGLGRCMPPGC